MPGKFIKAFFTQPDLEYIPFSFNGTGTAVMTFGGSELALTDNGVGDYTLTLKGGRASTQTLWFSGGARSDTASLTVTVHDTGTTTTAIRLKVYTTNTAAATDAKVHGEIVVKRGKTEY